MTIIETLLHSVRFRIRIWVRLNNETGLQGYQVYCGLLPGLLQWYCFRVRLNNETGVQGVPGLLWSDPRIVAIVLFWGQVR